MMKSVSVFSGEEIHSYIAWTHPELAKQKNICIYTGFVNQPSFGDFNDTLIDQVRNYILERYTEGTKLFFDCYSEGIVWPLAKTIHRIIDTIVEPKDVYFFTSSVNANEIYSKECEKLGIVEKINIHIDVVWDKAVRASAARYSINYEIADKDKVFLCFNRVARPQRIVLLGLIMEKGLLDKSFYSYLHANHTLSLSNDYLSFIENLRNEYSEETLSTVKEQILKNSNLLPLKLNIEPNNNVTYILDSDLEYFRNSYFSVVTETLYNTKERSIFFSEKIFKPISMKHPFMLLNAPGSLKALRDLGYKTFNEIIDESYDNIDDPDKRMKAFVNELERISKNKNWQWEEWQKIAQPIVEHNYNHLMKVKWKN